MSELSLTEEVISAAKGLVLVRFSVAGLGEFELELEQTTAVRDVKKFAMEECNVQPEHMRLLYNDRVLKDSDTLECYQGEVDKAIQIHLTAGHDAMVGGSVPQRNIRNPYNPPVRGLPGSKGHRVSRMSGRLGGMGLIRKYGILMKRQEFREKAEEIGFRKYR